MSASPLIRTCSEAISARRESESFGHRAREDFFARKFDAMFGIKAREASRFRDLRSQVCQS